MSKIVITGCREYDFKDEETGRQVKGMSIYYKEKLEDQHGLRAKGFTTGKFSINPGTGLYKQMIEANYDKPFEAEVVFELLPGRKAPVLSSIII